MAAEVSEGVFTDVAPHIQDLVLDSPDVEQFLQDLALYSAERLGVPGHEIYCGITVIRRKKATTVASSNPCARLMDELQNEFGDGPCLAAMLGMATVHVPDLRLEGRWSSYIHAVAGQGILSLLSVPLPLEGETRGALNLYSQRPHAFSGEGIASVEAFSEQASKGLRLALRIGQLPETRDNMTAAMRSRTVIDLATGVLIRASSTRNMKLHDVAAAVIASISQNPDMTTYFDESPARASPAAPWPPISCPGRLRCSSSSGVTRPEPIVMLEIGGNKVWPGLAEQFSYRRLRCSGTVAGRGGADAGIRRTGTRKRHRDRLRAMPS